MTGQQKQWFDDLTAKRRKWVEANQENDFENGIKNLLTDLYPDNAHFIYELLQNAEDAGARTVRFTLTHESIEFEHDGNRLFSEKDVESITSIGTSTKKDDVTAIGKFGVGFKAVFAYTQTPEIHSGEFHFKILDLVVPKATKPCGVNGSTTFVFPFDNPKKLSKTAVIEIERSLRELADNTLLFLSNISKIEYLLPDGNNLGSLERIDTNQHQTAQGSSSVSGSQIEIHSFQPGTPCETVTHWLRYTGQVDAVNDNGQHAACRIAAAFKLEPVDTEEAKPAKGKSGQQKAAWKIVPCDPGQVSIFFPCEKETSKLRFHLHAPFASTVARDSVRDCPDNHRLRDGLAKLVAENLSDIRDRGLLTMDFLAVLPIPDDALSPFYAPIRSAIVTAFKTQELTPAKGGGHKKAGELYRGPAEISGIIDDDDLAFLAAAHPTRRWASNAPQRGQRADKFHDSLEIDKWEWEQLAEVIGTSEKAQQIEVWIAKKNENWLMHFYGLLHHVNDQEYSRWPKTYYYQVRRLKLVRAESLAIADSKPVHLPSKFAHKSNTVCHVSAEDVFFPLGQSHSTTDVLFVKPEVYDKNGSNIQKTAAREFLKSIGVREYDERAEIERLLKTYSGHDGGKRIDDSHLADICAFVAYWKDHPLESVLFKEHKFLLAYKRGDKQLYWTKPSCVCLDTPYYNTGLASLCDVHGKMILSDQYVGHFNKSVSQQDFVDFLKGVGVMSRVIINKCSAYDNPLMKAQQWWSQGRFTDNSINEDWTIENIDKYLATDETNKKLAVAKLIWPVLTSARKEVSLAQYRSNGRERLLQVLSMLVQHLKAAAWIPGKDGVFRKPQDMTRDMLPDDFSYDDGNGLLTAIGFGENAKRQSAEHQEREAKAKEFGFSAEELDELARAKKEGRLQIIPKAEFPDTPVRDPARRSSKIAEEVAAAPDKTYETRERSVRTSKGSVDAAPYLSNLYTNEDGQMVCQGCHREMPFKKRDGKPYFEAVEAFGREHVNKEHLAQHLALCPLCAAKFKEYVKRDATAQESLKEDILTTPEKQFEFDLVLDIPARFRFTERHLLDIRSVLSTQVQTGV